ncbi:unnamed protein product [Calypogeia fissa]
MEKFIPPPLRSSSVPGAVLIRDFDGMEKKSPNGAALEARIGDISLRFLKEDTSTSGSPLERRPTLSGDSRRARLRPRSLVSLCVGNLGSHLEDIHDEVHLFAPACPAPIKASLLAIARRRGLLSDQLLVALADESWEILDVSGSDVTDASMQRVAELCPRLQAVDISRCSRLTPLAVRSLVQHCPAIHTLRWGGTSMSNATARSALSYILPKLNLNEEAESWEELDTKRVGKGVQALRWLVWPSIDSKSSERLEMECPRVVVNPKPFSKGFQLLSVPWEARPGTVLDASAVEDIEPHTWAVMATIPRTPSRSNVANHDTSELSVAERFKLAFVARDERLAPKRAKNMRQNQRRLEKAWLNSDPEAKSRAWAGIARKSLKGLDG